MKTILFVSILLMSFSSANSQIFKTLKKISKTETFKNIKKGTLDILEDSKAKADIDFNYAVSFSDNSGMYESEEKLSKYRSLAIVALKSDDLSNFTPKEKAQNLNELGERFYSSNRFRPAELAFFSAFGIYEYNLITDTKDAALTISNIGLVLHSTGKYNLAEQYTQRALEISKNVLNDDKAYATELNNLAVLYKDMGKYNESEKLINQALDINKNIEGTSSLAYAFCLNNKAILFQNIGRYNKAKEMLNESIDIASMYLKDKSPNFIRLKVNLALLNQLMNNLDRAEVLYLECLSLQEKRLGHKHPDYAALLRNLASLYQIKGEYDKVEKYLLEAANIYKVKFGSKNQLYAKTISELAVFYQFTGNLTQAETLLNEAIEIQSKRLSSHHPDFVATKENLAILYWQKSDYQSAYSTYKEVLDEYIYQINTYFTPMSEDEKSRFWEKIHPKFLRFYAFANQANNDIPKISKDVYNYHIATKALLLNSTSKIKNKILNSGNQELITKYTEWTDTKKYLSKLYTLSAEELQDQNINIDSVEYNANKKEKELSQLSADFAQGVSGEQIKFDDIKLVLNDNEAAIELIRFTNYKALKIDTSTYYLALVINKNCEYPEMICFSNGNELETTNIKKYRRSMQRAFETNNFYDIFWKPIETPTITCNKLYLSLDGIYNQVNINTLQDSNKQFVIDKKDIVYLTNTKELIHLKEKELSSLSKTKNAVLFGNPNYALNLNWDEVKDMPLPELPGTKIEIEKINNILNEYSYNSKTYLKNEATESEIKQLNQPDILHIATHGFFLEDTKTDATEKIFGIDPIKAAANPLLRSGLMFAGADNTIQQIGKRENKKTDDGILNAYETMLLNLDNTRLVVLSACETGLGEIKNGEGVYGLQRALQIAGSENIIISLWQVSDEVTQKLMTHFYKYYLETGNTSEAFKKSQMEIKKQYPAPFYWGAFILVNN